MKKTITLLRATLAGLSFLLGTSYLAASNTIALGALLDDNGKIANPLELIGEVDFYGFYPVIDECEGLVFLPLPVAPGWNALGTGLGGVVRAIAISGNNVYVGGGFLDAGGNPNADRIARWDGSSWHALGTGLSNTIRAIAISGNDVYVGGTFDNAGGNANADNIARWDGTSWNPLGTGLNMVVRTIAVSGSDVYVGGDFTDAGGNASADRIARWDGSSWNALGTGLSAAVFSIAISGSNVYAGGDFLDAGGNANADRIARWDGSSWNAMGTGLNDGVNAVAASGSNVYVGGAFLDAGGNPNADRIARWDGSSWNALGPGLGDIVSSITISGSNVYVGGNFIDAGNRIARWDGSSWNALGTGLNSPASAIAVSGGNVYAGGNFTDGGGNPDADRIARWEGPACPTFSGAPANVTITNSTCASACTLSGGVITAPGGTPCPAGSTLQYQVNGGSWTTTLPVYDQDGPAQSIKTRCSCDITPATVSAESAAVVTVPGVCTSPSIYNVTGGGAFCSGTGVAVGLSGSESGVTYQLKNGVVNVASATGTGLAISFGNQTTPGSYSVVATKTIGGCTAMMAGSATVTNTSITNAGVNILDCAVSAKQTTTISNYTVSAGANRLLVVTASDGLATNITGVTFNGQAMTMKSQKTDGTAVDAIFTLTLGTSATPTTGNIVMTSANANNPGKFISAISFYNVDQTTPVNNFLQDQNTINPSVSSLNVVSATGDMVFSIFDTWKMTSPTTFHTAGSGLVVQASDNFYFGGSNGYGIYSIALKSGAGSVPTSWTTTNHEALIQIAFNIKQAAACVTPSAPTGTLAITNSTCTACVVGGGSIAIGTVSGTGGTLQYSTDNGANWSATLPTYNQTGPAQTIIASVLDANGCRSNTTAVGTTVPGTCTTPSAPTGTLAITNSTCTACVVGGGSIAIGTVSGTGGTLQYSTNNGANWSATLPTYNQTGPAQTIIASVLGANGCRSNTTAVGTTVPGTCITPGAPSLVITDNVCPSSSGTISATGCGAGTVTEYATDTNGPWSTTAPSYTTSAFTVYARCRNTTTGCTSSVVNQTTAPTACSTCPTFSSAPGEVRITNSSCSTNCTISGGLIEVPTLGCPSGSTIEYSTDGGQNWSATLPTYNQTGPAQSIKTRCVCDTDANTVSAESAAVVTVPGTLSNPVVPANGSSSVACLSAATAPTLPTVTGCDGSAITPTGPVITNIPDPITCEGTRTYTYTYTCGSTSSTWSFVYTIERVPFTVPANGASEVACLANATAPTLPTVTSNCGETLTPSAPVITDTPNPLTCEGTRTYAYTYTDCEGNTAIWSYVYTIERNPFTIATPNGASTVACLANATAPALPTVTSACGETLTPAAPVITDTPNPLTCEGTRTYAYTYTDCEGNTATWSYVYTIERNAFTIATPNGASTVACLANATAPTLPTVLSACGEILTPAAPVITDTPNPLTCEGTRTYAYTYTDCEGNTATWSYVYTIERNAFTIATPNGASTVACLANATAPTLPTVTSACGETLTPTGPVVTDSPDPLTCEGTRTYAYTYTDCEGNTAVWSFVYTIERVPFTAPANGASTVACLANATAPTLPTVTSACGETLTPAPAVITDTPNPLTCEGTRTYAYTYTDCEGNTATWSYVYTIERVPFTAPANGAAMVNDTALAVTPTLPTVTSNCGEVLTPTGPVITNNPNPLDCTGTRTYAYTYTDCEGNTAIWSFVYTIIDNSLPSVTCTPGTVNFNGEQSIALNANSLVTASDNCGIQSISLSPSSISATQVGQNVQVTATVTDINGNMNTCNSMVTVGGLPEGWNQQPGGVGCTSQCNDFEYNSGTGIWTGTATGAFYGPPYTSDATAFAQRTLCGDGSITARVTSINPSTGGWAGVVMRESNDAGAVKIQLMTNLGTFHRREVRTVTNGSATLQQFSSQSRHWLRIVRAGSQFAMYASPNGTTWYLIGSQTISMGNCIQIGLVATNSTSNGVVTATFSGVSHTGNNTPLSLPVGGLAEMADFSANVAPDFNVYPNPTSGELNLDLTAYAGRSVRIEVYSIEGKLLQFSEIDEVQAVMEQLDLAKFKNGMYLIKVKCNNLPEVAKRVVLQRE